MAKRNGGGWWSWPGAVAFVIAFFVAGGWAMGIYLAATPPSVRSVGTSSGLDVLSTVGGVLAGAVASYLGAIVGGRYARRQPELEPEMQDSSP